MDRDDIREWPDHATSTTQAHAIVATKNLTRPRKPYHKQSITIEVRRLSKEALEIARRQNPPEINGQYNRPRTRGECAPQQPGEPPREHAQRPCPFVSCKHHLYTDISERNGSIKLNFPNLEVWDLPESCALDIADRDGLLQAEVARFIGITRERARQLEARCISKLQAAMPFDPEDE